MSKQNIIIGAGSWGSALAKVISRNLEKVLMYTQNSDVAREINTKHTNHSKINSIKLPENVFAINYIPKNIETCIIAIPVKYIKTFLKNSLASTSINNIVVCSKGIDVSELKFPSELCNRYFPNTKIGVLSGPNFAKEIAENKIAKSVLASKEDEILSKVINIFTTQYLKIEITEDIIGVEICGAVKNVIAIAFGIAQGLELGENFLAALFVNAIKEIRNLIKILGGNSDTANSFAGIGDVFLTSHSLTSRNTKFGYDLARNNGDSILEKFLVEGYYTAQSMHRICILRNIEAPICKFVYQVLYENKNKMHICDILLR